jgi:hypothetical protein
LKTLGNNPFYENGNSVCETANGGFLVAGITKSMRENSVKGEKIYNNDIYLIKLDTNGNTIWEKIIGGANSDWANSVVVTKTGEYVVLGHTDSYGVGSYDVCLMKIHE